MPRFRKYLITLLIATIGVPGFAQEEYTAPEHGLDVEFGLAYAYKPNIPRGLLEAVSYTQTRFEDLKGPHHSCVGIPEAKGLFGLVEDGKGYFNETLDSVAKYSNQTPFTVVATPLSQAICYVAALDSLARRFGIPGPYTVESLIPVLDRLSEIPHTSLQSDFAANARLYQILWFMEQSVHQQKYGFDDPQINMVKVFGKTNLNVLSAPLVRIYPNGIYSGNGQNYMPTGLKSPDYGPAIWDPAPSCNYSSRGVPVSAVTIHTIQGSYAGAISWSKNCSSNVSYHYVIRSSDGQITQMVRETDKAWHVGSENPYTIGYEHEGYVSNPAWYTNAMYNASAALTRDVCNSGYGISPLRTYYGPSSSGTNVLGACTRIKGHQHYPNQTHTDPGQYWDWEKYYKLINNAPTINTITANSGTFYDSGGSTGNYSDDERDLTLIQPPNASSVTISFSQFDLETNWDYMFIYDGATTAAPLIGKYTGLNNPGTITASSGSVLIEFRSDCATTNPGWACNWNASFGGVPGVDSIAPVSLISGISGWETSDFNVQFNDSDNVGGSGIDKQFYQVIYFNGTEWRANHRYGFFSDNFDSIIHPDWTIATGTWAINNKYLEQSNQALGNTNIYASVNQDSSANFLYHWACKIDGSGNNKRGGFHFMCDSAHKTNRGNSYFFWLREDDNKLQIYEVVNDVFTLVTDDPFNVVQGQWYDVKVTYCKTTGKIAVYVDNVLASTWTDATPLQNGNAVSFRSGNSIFTVNNLKIYHDRTTAVTIRVDSSIAGEVRFQNPNPTTPACRVKTIVTDSAGNISNIAFQDVNIDWTPPAIVDSVRDGLGTDEDTVTTWPYITGNWSLSNDSNSAIARYWYAIGSTAGDSDLVSWTDNWFKLNALDSVFQTASGTFYISVRAENGAGLLSPLKASDGQIIYFKSTVGIDNGETWKARIGPNPCKNDFRLRVDGTNTCFWLLTAGDGKIVGSNTAKPVNASGSIDTRIDVTNLAAGAYFLTVGTSRGSQTIQLIKQ